MYEPAELICSICPSLASMENAPFASATADVFVPLTNTVAKGTGSPFSFVILPVTVRACPIANADISINNGSNDRNFLMLLGFILVKNSWANIGKYEYYVKKL
jgi:hypothetical protein